MTRPPARSGFTMYEVVLSLSILFGALAVLGQLISTGSQAAIQSRLRTEAMLRCQSQVSEVIAGAANGTLRPVNNEILETNGSGSWTWSLQITDGRSSVGGVDAALTNVATAVPHADLIRLDVTVSRVTSAQTVAANAELTRFIRTPELYVEAAVEAAELAAETQE